jgi:uncharacterized membrane protein YhhN
LERGGLFVPGLVAFLLAHILYASAFVSDTRTLRFSLALPFAAYGVAAFVFLRPGLDAMKLPVAVYMTAICTMMWRAAARLGRSPRGAASARAALLGSMSFAASDSLIALDRFHAPISYAGWPVMILYWLGQLLIALSARV